MNIYLISQCVNQDYDTYDSAVVVAKTEEDARDTSPRGGKVNWPGGNYGSWASKREEVSVELLGEAKEDLREGVICASFNAG